jgi:hypothetical protein
VSRRRRSCSATWSASPSWLRYYPPARLIERLNGVFSEFDLLARELEIEKIKTVGDAYMAAAGLPLPREDHAAALRAKGVLARFGIDFLAVREGAGWRHWAIEVNLRKGGTTHPFLMLQFLTDGRYDPGTGLYHTPAGRPCFYVASDNLQAER